ncbi:MAG: FCD domain-containing protein [Pseudomonadota bacterium]
MTSFAKINTAPTYRRLYDAIETEIMRGRLKPGAKLPTETDLAGQFGVNRSTVREAIRLLEQTGLVERASSRRLVVSKPSTDQLASGITRALVMHQVSFSDLWAAMMAMEPAVAEGAAHSITPDQIAALEQNVSDSRACLNNPKQFCELDHQFHTILAEAAGNRVLDIAREPINLLFHPAVSKVMTQLSQASSRTLEAHEQILTALKTHDAMNARHWMTKHIDDFRRGYEHAGFDLNGPIDIKR